MVDAIQIRLLVKLLVFQLAQKVMLVQNGGGGGVAVQPCNNLELRILAATLRVFC